LKAQKSSAAFEFAAEFPLRESPIGERFTIEEDTWWEEHTAAQGELFTGWACQVNDLDGERIRQRRARKDGFGVITEAARWFGQQRHPHRSVMRCFSFH
jgi:hypothetical protein